MLVQKMYTLLICKDCLHGDGDNGNSVIIGASHGNVKIESWWGFYRKHNAEFFMTLFHGLRNEGLFCGDETDKEVLRFCFLNIIQVLHSLLL